MSQSPFEVNVSWVGPSPQSSQFYAIPKGKTTGAKLSIRPKLGQPQPVSIAPIAADWLDVEGGEPRSGIPPFETIIGVDTSMLEEGMGYEERIKICKGDEVMAVKLVRVFVKPLVPEFVEEESSQSILAKFAGDAYQWAGDYARATPEERQEKIDAYTAEFQDKAIQLADSLDVSLDKAGTKSQEVYHDATGKVDEVAAHFGIDDATKRAEQNAKEAAEKAKKTSGRWLRGASRWVKQKSQDMLEDEDTDDSSETE